MQLIVGLGNPGKIYQKNRHNLGFYFIEAIKKNPLYQIEGSKINKTLKAEITKVRLKDKQFMLAEPQTFMNGSGGAIKSILSYFKLSPPKILVVLDDLNLKVGEARIRFGGSSGGHKGLESIIQNLKRDDFWRLRIGIGPQNQMPAEKFVLTNFKKREKEIIDQLIKFLLEDWLIKIVLNQEKLQSQTFYLPS